MYELDEFKMNGACWFDVQLVHLCVAYVGGVAKLLPLVYIYICSHCYLCFDKAVNNTSR